MPNILKSVEWGLLKKYSVLPVVETTDQISTGITLNSVFLYAPEIQSSSAVAGVGFSVWNRGDDSESLKLNLKPFLDPVLEQQRVKKHNDWNVVLY